MNIIEYLQLRNIKAEERTNNEIWFCCPFHEGDKTPSCSINKLTEEWHCFGCGASGKNLNSFEYLLNLKSKKKNNLDYKTFPEEIVLDKHERLITNENILKRLWEERRINLDVIKRFKIGWDGSKIWIPIYYEDKILNIKVWDAFKLNHTKYSWLGTGEEGYITSGLIFPQENISQTDIFYTEGESDCLSALSAGYNALTGGGTGFDFVYILRQLKGKKITLCYDNDGPGIKASKKSFNRLQTSKIAVREIKLSSIGAQEGYDFIDCIKIPDFKIVLDAYLEELEYDEVIVIENNLDLSEGMSSKYFKKTISFEAHIVTLATAPKQIAKKIMMLGEDGKRDFFELDINNHSDLALCLYNSSADKEGQIIKRFLGLDKENKIIILETQNLLEMVLQQDFQYTDDIKDPVNFQVLAYTTDYKISPFKTYEFTAKVIRDPINLHPAFFVINCDTRSRLKVALTDVDLSWLKLFTIRSS